MLSNRCAQVWVELQRFEHFEAASVTDHWCWTKWCCSSQHDLWQMPGREFAWRLMSVSSRLHWKKLQQLTEVTSWLAIISWLSHSAPRLSHQLHLAASVPLQWPCWVVVDFLTKSPVFYLHLYSDDCQQTNHERRQCTWQVAASYVRGHQQITLPWIWWSPVNARPTKSCTIKWDCARLPKPSLVSKLGVGKCPFYIVVFQLMCSSSQFMSSLW